MVNKMGIDRELACVGSPSSSARADRLLVRAADFVHKANYPFDDEESAALRYCYETTDLTYEEILEVLKISGQSRDPTVSDFSAELTIATTGVTPKGRTESSLQHHVELEGYINKDRATRIRAKAVKELHEEARESGVDVSAYSTVGSVMLLLSSAELTRTSFICAVPSNRVGEDSRGALPRAKEGRG